jgi:hypothetical protein
MIAMRVVSMRFRQVRTSKIVMARELAKGLITGVR